MNKYKEYKNTGIKWIGSIPKHWKVSKIKYITFDLISGGTPLTSNKKYWTENNEGIHWVSIADMSKNFKVIETNKKITLKGLKEKGLKILPKGTLIYSIFATLGKVCELEIEATTNQAILGIFENPKKIKKNFLKYYLFDLEKDIKSLSSSNTQENINSTKVENIKITLPPLQEQQQIANYLDKKTQNIDKILENTQKQIKSLKEYEKSLINRVVTKGLNENVELIDSGIEWIGQVPKHWEIKKLKYLFNFSRGLTITKENLKNKGIPCLNYGEIHSKYRFEFNPNKNKVKFVDEKYLKTSQKSLLKYGDFIFADTSEDIEGCGNFTYLNSNEKVFAGYHTIIIKLKLKNNFRFIAYLFNSDSFRNQIRKKVKGVKVYSITNLILKEILLLLPQLQEQEQITNHLDKKTQKLQNLIKNKEKQVNLFKELRKTIINDAVTGKIKV